jgi:hypothetical protein
MSAEFRRVLRDVRWWELVPEAVLVAGLTWFLVDETDAATSAFASTKAVVLMAVVATAWIVLRVLFALLVRRPVVRLLVFGAAAIAVLAVVVLPAYDDTTVVESFPEAAAEPAPAPSSTAPGASTTSTTAPTAPVVLGTGMLEGIDHRAMGTVRIYEQPDGAQVVGLEDIDVQPGPDYDVYVAPGSDRDHLDGAIRLDDLRGNKGTQFYDVAGADLRTGAWTVLIWCETFDVPIANATPV